jgi:aryl-alcohol dehydrogenase-like predicted oxidoreductase
MKKLKLGKTEIEVTELCFGALPMGPLQKNIDDETGAKIIEKALLGGVNFIDTAQLYKTYKPIKMALERTGIRPVIASKCKESEYNAMEDAVGEALRSLNLEYIDIFHMHA